MMTSYYRAFFRANKIKMIALCLSLASYFALVVIAANLNRAIPEIARLPLQQIGVQTIVQKTGEIPGHMVDAIFPHSNAPISLAQYKSLAELPFVENADWGLYFWYFDSGYFKAALGVDPKNGLFSDVLEKNLNGGTLEIGQNRIVVAAAFGTKHGVEVGDSIRLGDETFTVDGILKANVSGNIVPADMYMDIHDALRVVRKSAEMQKIYQLNDGEFANVVLLKSNPGWQGDKEKLIKAVDKKLLVFSEKTFTREISQQLGMVSATGRLIFIALGIVLLIAFGLLTLFNLKTREREIAILRMLGWSIRDLKKQFIGENMVLLGISLILGSCLTAVGILLLGYQKVSMELPWDISARPHFLPAENAIERVVTAPLPIHFDIPSFIWVIFGFLLLFLIVSLLSFRRLKKISPAEFTA